MNILYDVSVKHKNEVHHFYKIMPEVLNSIFYFYGKYDEISYAIVEIPREVSRMFYDCTLDLRYFSDDDE